MSRHHTDPTTSNTPSRRKRMTVPSFSGMKGQRKISMVTAYDFPMAEILDESGIDAILVGDTLSMVVQGHETTLPVTLDEMIYHAEMVGRAVRQALVIVDLPFPSYHLGVHKAVENAGEILKRSSCQAVKLEGGAEQAEVIAGLVAAGIPVMAHVGLRPQSIHQLGAYRVQRDADVLLRDAQAVARAGAFSVVLECIPSELAKRITDEIAIPTIGIGAGKDCDGQVLVLHDLLGLTPGRLPKHARRFGNLRQQIAEAIRQYQAAVGEGSFPAPHESF